MQKRKSGQPHKGWKAAARKRHAKSGWRPMATAPKDREILVRRHNDVFFEHMVVWWDAGAEPYPWTTEYTAYPTDRLDGWHEIPR